MLKKKLTRNKLIAFIAKKYPCLIGLEACGGAYWVPVYSGFWYTVKMIAPRLVKLMLNLTKMMRWMRKLFGKIVKNNVRSFHDTYSRPPVPQVMSKKIRLGDSKKALVDILFNITYT